MHVVAPNHDRQAFGAEHLARLSLFGFAGPVCVSRGWSVYPQEGAGGLRRPGQWRGMPIQLRKGEAGDLALQPPALSIVREWALENPNHNVACILGRGSGGAFALDFDVETPERAAALKDLAFSILGETPFIRIGNAPRFAMIYRTETWEGEHRVVNIGRRFDVASGARPGEALEILAEGKTLTLLGRHHKTGKLFLWEGMSPLMAGPEAAPVVDGRALALFLDEVHQRFPFATEIQAQADGWTWDESTRARVPRIRIAAGMAPWRSDPETGLIVDGREAFLTRTCFGIVMGNPELAGMAAQGNEGARGALASAAAEAFRQAVLLSDGKWPETRIRSSVQEKIARLIRKVQDGSLRPRLPNESERATSERVRLGAWDTPPELRFLKSRDRRSPRGLRASMKEPPDPVRAASRAIEADRDAVGRRISEAIDHEIALFLDQVYAWQAGKGIAAPVHVLKAPTGSGKTSRLLSALLRDPRTIEPPRRDGEAEWGPFIILLPTFANIQELVLRLAAEHGPKDQAASPPVLDIGSEEFLPVDLVGPGGRPLSVFVYRGKIKAGCRMHEKVAALMKVGRSSSSLCRAEIQDSDERREVFCPHYETCPAILQRERAARSHIVFMPHAFLTLSLPEQLRRPRAVIIDERVHHLLLHAARLSLETLTLPRTPPRLSRKERENGVIPEDLLADREMASSAILRGVEEGVCPSIAMFREFGTERGKAMAKSAARVCGTGLQRDERIHPETSLQEILEICAEPKGFEVREEWRFWRMIEERLEGIPSDEQDPDPDLRFQKIVEQNENGFERAWIRMAWRSEPNWRDVPLLLLDASGEPAILHKVFPSLAIKVADLVPDPGPMLNVRVVACVDRTFSSSSLLVRPDADEREIRQIERNLSVVRDIIECVSLVHGYGRVLVGGPKAVLERLCVDWNPPVNVDWAHFGAMRGLDAFKNHVAAVSVGRMEPPIWEVDAAAAALSYDEEQPEMPFDRRGDCRDPNDPDMPLFYPLRPRPLPLRDGSLLSVPVPEHPGFWGRLVQAQIREEEQRQFFGRLRPVYRKGPPPVWYCLSSVVPENVVVDEICSSRDLFEESLMRLARKVNESRGMISSSFIEDKTNSIYMKWIDALLCSDGGVPAPLRRIGEERELSISYLLSCLPTDQRRLRILAARAGATKSFD